jgi:ligand-binding sensor domain-containing protein/signal transduction histidine kinase
MHRFPSVFSSSVPPPEQASKSRSDRAIALALRAAALILISLASLIGANTAVAVVLWSDLGATLIHDTGAGSSFLTGSAMDILGGAVRADDSSTNTLYFKFHVDPLSDVNTEEYFAALQFYEGDTERLGVGDSLKAWAYSAFNTDETGAANKIFGDVDLHSATPEPAALGTNLSYEFPRRGNERTIVVKVQYVAGGKDIVTVWLNPDLTPGATETSQPENLITRFTADASFNQIRLRHGGGGGGWTFSDMAIATSFGDFVASSSIESGAADRDSTGGPLSFTIRTWRREQGLPQNSVRALAQTRDGYLWVGTDDGVARFDGLRFVSYGLREGLTSVPVSTLLADSHGDLWVGSRGGGLSRWQDGRFTTFTMQDGLPHNSITAMEEDGDGRLWIGTESGLTLWQGGHLSPMSSGGNFQGRTITTLFKDRQGNMWLGAAGVGVFQFQDGKFVPLMDASVEGLLLDPHCLLVDQGGQIWIGAGDDYVLCRDGDEWHRYRIPRHLARPHVSALVEEPDGTVWAGSVSEGLFQFRGGKLAAFNASSGLSDNLVESLLVDREGKLWVGTDTGLNRLRRKTLFALGQNEGLGYGAVQGLAEFDAGAVLVAKPNEGVYRWNGRHFSRLTGGSLSKQELQIHSFIQARDGGCWAAGANGLLHFKDPSALTDQTDDTALNGLNVISLAEDAQGELWAGTHDGQLWRKQGTNWLAQTNPWQPHAITAIVPDADGVMWIATEGDGLYRCKGNTRAHFNKTNGLLSDSIRTLYLDAQGTLWAGTTGGGLSRLKNGHLTTITTREGLPDNNISQILEDSSGRLWLGNNRGLACVSKRELAELAAGKIPVVYPKVYGAAEGMLSEECASGYFPAGLRTRSGLLWFSTAKGIVVADARPRASDVIAPRAVLEEVFLDGVADAEFRVPASRESPAAKIVSLRETEPGLLHISPGQHRIEFQYTGLSFDAPERMRFRYRLEGLDPDWVEAGTVRKAFYNFVPPGNYRFRVIACNADGVWDETGASVDLLVLRHFWEAWWIVTLAVLGLLISVGGTIRLVERRKLHRRLSHLEQERALQRERARIAQDLHDDLGSSLARISLLSGLAKADKDNPSQVETHVDKISHSAAQTVRALEEIVWAVRPGSDSLQSLMDYIAHFANELFEDNTTRCRLDLPLDLPPRPLPPDVRHNIFLIVKEALTNALKHASAREVRVQAKASANTLEIVVQDDGKGFDLETAAAKGQRNGLGNMRRRAESVRGSLTVETARGNGTKVRLVVDFTNARLAE